ncbi:hypothetical protein J3L18_05420 [Mucilaginibacter gossypii]|uniref:hypothetical protein n=1 Tax=Mucilaginibacter gossypii TaxID=551996 RepID=UPI00101A7521|nr:MULTISPECIES: hypothetical protein [Mucilaginibacter]QTE38518.1 hypothetical protein J3L18_05420 [Mucilaginibacter gossypii]
MKMFLKKFDSPVTAIMCILTGVMAFSFLVMGIFQAYTQIPSAFRFALGIGVIALLAAVFIVGYWMRQAVKK